MKTEMRVKVVGKNFKDTILFLRIFLKKYLLLREMKLENIEL